MEYKDPELEEWEKFKKSMLEVNKVCIVVGVHDKPTLHTLLGTLRVHNI